MSSVRFCLFINSLRSLTRFAKPQTVSTTIGTTARQQPVTLLKVTCMVVSRLIYTVSEFFQNVG